MLVIAALMVFSALLREKENLLPVHVAPCSRSYKDKIDRIPLKDEIHEENTQPNDPFVIQAPD